MEETHERTLERTRRYLRDRLRPHLYRDVRPARVSAWATPGEPIPFAEAIAQRFVGIEPGEAWGPPWGTTWFRVAVDRPQEARDGDAPAATVLVVDLGFTEAVPGFQCEALAYDEAGRVLGGIEPLNRVLPLPLPGPGAFGHDAAGSEVVIWLEAAANPDIAQQFRFTPTPLGDRATAGDAPQYRLGAIFTAVRELELWELMQDLTVLAELGEQLDPASPRRARIMTALSRALDTIDTEAPEASAAAARAQLRAVLDAPAAPSAHTVHAVGHAHIDSAWLWPLRETRRKVARTFANVLRLMEEDERFVFAASSAQHYAWLKADHPDLFERVRARVAEGRFVPVGGQWVEPDSNLPGGESLVRQFVEGTRFFVEEFGVHPREVWVPDSFGYSAALPQIARAAGANAFLTQKLSWNDTNRFPHHSFLWEGIDGTRIFTHFPPADTYNARVSAEELLRAERQLTEAGNATTSLLPFGWGDGGGGPTREMLAAAHRFGDLEGAPRVRLSSPATFFAHARHELDEPPVWVGELYLEAHRGVSTTQIAMKRGNRRAEALAREAELWCTVATVRAGAAYPADALRALWHEVLLLQFHDILPGTSIAWVHAEARARYEAVHARFEALIGAALRLVLGTGTLDALVNSAPVPVRVRDAAPPGASLGLGPMSVAPVGASAAAEAAHRGSAEHSAGGDGAVLRAHGLTLRFDARGEIVSLVDERAERELVPRGQTLGRFRLFRDVPTRWDAWDLDARVTSHPVDTASEMARIDVDAGAPAVTVTRRLGASTVVARYGIDPHARAIEVSIEVDWREHEKLLKWELPLALHTAEASAEVQFGHVRRSIHRNTSWDAARFETSAQRWVHVGEPDYGVALANAWTYGAGIRRDVREAAGDGVALESSVTIGVTLARAPAFPDPAADRGVHRFGFLLAPGAGIAQAIELGYRLQLPLRALTRVARAELAPFVETGHPGILVEAVKLSQDGRGDVIVRLYESHGARARVRVTTAFSWTTVTQTDLHEEVAPSDGLGVAVGENDGTGDPGDAPGRAHAAELQLRPFQIVTLRFSGVQFGAAGAQ